jgi:hypothetical protein
MLTSCQHHANPIHANPMRARPKNNPGTKKEKKGARQAGCYLLIYLLLIPPAQ